MTSIEDLYSLFIKNSEISTDSRNIIPGSLFFAMKGETFDGNRYAADALDNGAAFAVIDDPVHKKDDRYILVSDTLAALQDLARFHREKSKARIIGITGSNGKTTTKELIGKVLSTCYKTRVTKGNLNNQIGVPLTLLKINETDDFGVIEMGANHPGEIKDLCNISCPDFGLITNIGKAHLEGFGSFEGVIKTKSELYQFIRQTNGRVFLNIDNQLLVSLAKGIHYYSYGTSLEADCSGAIVSGDPFLTIKWSCENHSGTIRTNLYGDYNLENILAAVCIGMFFNIPPEKIDLAISSYHPDNNRSQWVDTGKNILIMDAYNANPSSMKAALANFRKLESLGKWVILGDMMELGADSLAEHQSVIQLAEELTLKNLILIGDQFFQIRKSNNIICFRTIEEAEAWFRLHPVEHSAILLKGSRKMQLEKLTRLF
jgi:UDP-N-acetylmuramoyl-tripeptide--D-alanyl-D-alanine ligase